MQNAVREDARFWVRWDGNGRRDRADAALTLGGEVDALQEAYAREDRLLECYMAEVFSDELMRLACGQLNEWILENAGCVWPGTVFSEKIHSCRWRICGSPFAGGGGGNTLQSRFLPDSQKESGLRNAAEPGSGDVLRGICSGCGRKNCPNRNEEENGG